MSKSALFCAAVLCGSATLLSQPAAAQLLGGGLTGGVTGAVQAPLGVGAQGALSGTVDATSRLPTQDVISRTRDAAGRVTTVTRDARGRVFATTRDARGRLIDRTRVTAEAVSGVRSGVAVSAAVPDVGVDVRRRDAIVASGVTVLQPGQTDVYMDRQIVDLRRELAGTNVDVVRRGDRIVLVLPSDITFAFDKSDIQPKFRPVLDSIARTLNAYPSTYVDVTGHADAIGTDAYNQRLSERRADAVSAYLRQRGAVSARLHAEGRGEQDPVASNATISGRAANRRVEIDLTPVVG